MKNIIEDLKAKKDCSFLVKKKVEKDVIEDTMNISNINNKSMWLITKMLLMNTTRKVK